MNPITVDACRALAVIGVRTGSTSTETGSSSLGANRLALVTDAVARARIGLGSSPDLVLLERSRTWRS